MILTLWYCAKLVKNHFFWKFQVISLSFEEIRGLRLTHNSQKWAFPFCFSQKNVFWKSPTWAKMTQNRFLHSLCISNTSTLSENFKWFGQNLLGLKSQKCIKSLKIWLQLAIFTFLTPWNVSTLWQIIFAKDLAKDNLLSLFGSNFGFLEQIFPKLYP